MKIGTISILVVLALLIGYTWYIAYGLNQSIIKLSKENLRQQAVIGQLKILSPIEIDNIDLQKANLNIEKYTKLEAENKKKKEQAIWKTRCLKKKLV